MQQHILSLWEIFRLTIRYIDLFCGIGGFRLGAQKILTKYSIDSKCVFSSDIDLHCQSIYSANFGETPVGDISAIPSNTIPDHDLLFAGFPCQPFSIIGNGKGFEDIRGTLFFEIARILKAKSPKAFLLENVKRLVGHDSGRTMKKIIKTLQSLGYKVEYKVLNALDFGLPQKRERVFIVGYQGKDKFSWPEKVKQYIPLSNILEQNVDAKFIASEYIQTRRKNAHKPKESPSIWHENKSGNISSHPYSLALRANASHNYLLVNGERRLTSREMLRLQGFPDSYKIVVPYSQVRKQAGNAVPVNLVVAVLESLLPIVSRKISVATFKIRSDQKPITQKYERKKIPAFTHGR